MHITFFLQACVNEFFLCDLCVHTCFNLDSDNIWHAVMLLGTRRAERVEAWVSGAHLHPGGAVRPDAELHQSLVLLHHSAYKNHTDPFS